jgi:endo-alpha-1,4-polygalactosaminidase (GH114 family)
MGGLGLRRPKVLGLVLFSVRIVKVDNAEFEVLQNRGPELFRRRELSRLLYRTDVDRAVDAMVEDPDDDVLYEKFIQDIQQSNWK